jgi:putative transposase
VVVVGRDPDSPAERSRKAKAAKLARWEAAHPSVQRTWRYRMEPTIGLASGMKRMADLDRALWNMIHEWWLVSNRPLHRVQKSDLDTAVAQARRDIPWLAELPAQACQSVAKRYWRAWERCWSGASGAPRFHKRSESRPSFDIPQARDLNITRVSKKFATVHVPKVGNVPIRYHRPIPVGARVTGARVTGDSGRWTLALRVELPKPNPRSPVGSRPVVGFDRGVAIPLAGSDGTEFGHPDWLTPGERRHLRCLERQSARKRHARWDRSGGRGKGKIGANERKTYTAIASIWARAARRRKDWHHQTSRTIADRYSVAVFETLRIKNMTASAKGTVEKPGTHVAAKSGLNRVILNEGWGTLLDLVRYKMADSGGAVVTVPAPGTSQTCHACGSTTPGQRKSQALFVCGNTRCGWAGNADFNAACNILNRAVSGGFIPTPSAGTVDDARPRYKLGKRPDVVLSVGTEAPSELDGPRKRENRLGQRTVVLRPKLAHETPTFRWG